MLPAAAARENRRSADLPAGETSLLRPVRAICAAVSCLLFCCGLAMAKPVSGIEESHPSVYFLPDKDGKLQPVLGFGYEEFSELYQLKNRVGRSDRLPQFSIEHIFVSGTAATTYAKLSIRFEIRVRDDGWVRVPLRLDQGLLHEAVQYKGAGESFVDWDGDRSGYVCWLRGKPGSRHEIMLAMVAPLEAGGDETRLKLCFPRAAAAEMKLSAPLGSATASVSQGATLLGASAKGDTATEPGKRHSGDTTEFSVVGLPTDFQLAWRTNKATKEETAPVIEATGTALARLDDRGVSTDATLAVRSLTSAFDRFVVRLPAGAELSPGSQVGPTSGMARDEETLGRVTALGGEQSKATSRPQRGVEVRLDRKTTGPVEVRLSCRRDCDVGRPESWNELAGFEVIGAARQSGTVSLTAPDDRQVLFGTVRHIRPLDSAPETLRGKNQDIVASFEYFGQPYSLPVRVVVRPARLSVDPQYVLTIGREEARLEGRLLYEIAGAKPSTLELSMPGWHVDEVESAAPAISGDPVANTDGVRRHLSVVAEKGGKTTVSLRRPSSGRIELHLRAHRAIPRGAELLAIRLPTPHADVVGAASLAVVPEDSVEVIPDRRAIEGLEPTEAAPAMEIPAREQNLLLYRGTGGRAMFASTFRVLPPSIENENLSSSMVVDRAWYQSRFGAAGREDRAVYRFATSRRHLEVTLPDGTEAAQAEVTVDGKQVEVRLAADNQLIIPLEQPRSRQEGTVARDRDRVHVVELRYHFRESRPGGGLLSFGFPRLGPEAWTRRIYWQLVLPANEHLIRNPDGLTGEFDWGWDGYFWGRRPLLDETGLESWVGATERGSLPDRENRYLFSTLGRLDRVEVRTASRTWIVLLASGGVLAIGLLLIRVPAIRHPATLLVLAVTLMAAGLIAPEGTFLLTQASSLGLGLVLLAGVLERRVAGRSRRRAAMPKALSGLRVEVASNLGGASASAHAADPPSTKTLLPPVQPPGDLDL
ncbi:MAG: hypothetical protein LLG00_16500 [Planctomycetaceae bacterium]|nr:hypothetical protein [Planctomycetaceae bacterium]